MTSRKTPLLILLVAFAVGASSQITAYQMAMEVFLPFGIRVSRTTGYMYAVFPVVIVVAALLFRHAYLIYAAIATAVFKILIIISGFLTTYYRIAPVQYILPLAYLITYSIALFLLLKPSKQPALKLEPAPPPSGSLEFKPYTGEKKSGTEEDLFTDY